VASDVEDSTFITYDPPITALIYPLQNGESFSSTSTGSGTFEGLPYCSTDTYESAVAARGVVQTTAGDFPVLQVHTRQEVVVANCFNPFLTLTVEHRQAIFVTACTGAVVSVTSAADAPDFTFTEASRVRRVALPD